MIPFIYELAISSKDDRIAERSKLKPYLQGQLDAYCGVYSVVNAVQYLCGPLTCAQADRLFLKVMRFLENSQSAVSRLSNGTRFREILIAIEHISNKHYPIRRLRPFYRNKDVTLDVLWRDMSDFLANHNGVVILGLDGKHGHWSLVRKVTASSLLLFDSDKLHRLPKRHCTTDEDDDCLHILYPTKVLYLWTGSSPGGSND
ncbi:MAG: hypothetical protein OEY89_08150 [Gammaproteobacteria bacterium]|nr:hypothetical protein [Gammaproteobacteria bacterium]